MVAEVARARPGLLARLIVLSVVGTTLQAGALVGLFAALQHMGEGMTVDLGALLGWGGEVSAYAVFGGLAVLMGAGAWVVMLAERTAFVLSMEHANASGAAMLAEADRTAEPTDLWSIDDETGVASAPIKRAKSRTTTLERGVRLMVGSPLPTLTFVWSAGFLIWLEPWLTLIVTALVLPVLLPVRRIALSVKDLEAQRREAVRGFTDEVEATLAGGDEADGAGEAGGLTSRLRLSMARLTRHRQLRLRAEVTNKFYGIAALGVGILGAMVYFRYGYGAEAFPVATLVAYFAALQVTVMSGRQLVSRVTRFARFYRQVRKYREDRGTAWREVDPAGVRLPGVIKGPAAERFYVKGDRLVEAGVAECVAEDASAWRRVKQGDGPVAFVGTFVLTGLNRFAVVTAFDLASKKFADAIATTAVIDGESAATVTESMRRCERRGHRVVVATTRAVEAVGREAWSAWAAGRSEGRWVGVYHRLDERSAGRYGERWAVVLGAGRGGGPAIAAAEWAASHRGELADRLKQCAVTIDEGGDDDDDD
jgi:ABC-type multidrug transport system fused ATPase/permease subunit